MIDRSHGLSITRQAKLVRISRGTVYYRRKPPCNAQVQLMHNVDALHAAHPFAGSKGCYAVKGTVWGEGVYVP